MFFKEINSSNYVLVAPPLSPRQLAEKKRTAPEQLQMEQQLQIEMDMELARKLQEDEQ